VTTKPQMKGLKRMQAQLVKMLVTGLLAALQPEVLKKAVDGLLDIIEDAVAASENKVDDQVVLPMCKLIRTTFNIPDEDDAPTDTVG
jgi:hypothetical protein